MRYLKHIFANRWTIRRYFSEADLKRITDAIATSELKHRGEIMFAVEARLTTQELLQRKTSREKVIEAFSRLRVWDTEENNGVLIYLLLSDRRLEILADRGIHKKAGPEFFERICRDVESAYKSSQFLEGTILGIQQVSNKLEELYPRDGRIDINELSDKPVIL
ncbi:MAG: TPM domain-containing protein [Leptonema sp. (in: Bacteria)]|nr:TPM domain-containing protein [Leptonema sp. (in: bacteria)]